VWKKVVKSHNGRYAEKNATTWGKINQSFFHQSKRPLFKKRQKGRRKPKRKQQEKGGGPAVALGGPKIWGK